MKALVYEGIQKVDYREVTDPKIEKDDDIIVKVTSTAICGSDLHLVHGLVKGMYDGFVLGHETMGIVEEVGKEVTDFKKGDRVVIPFPVSCGHCFFCEHQEISQCDNTNKYGESGGLLGYSKSYGDYAGGQAQYIRVPHANVGPKKVPEELKDEQVLFLTDILPTSLWGTEIANYVESILEKIKNGEFDATDIITHTLPLEKGKYAYEIFDAKQDECIKVVLKP